MSWVLDADPALCLERVHIERFTCAMRCPGLCCAVTRPVLLRRKVGFWTVITVPTAITPYSTVKSTVSDRTRRCHRTV
jgi:hypothetical protein